MKAVPALLALFLTLPHAPAATIVVDPKGGGRFTAIQPAIDSAADGDLVLVEPGEYLLDEPIEFRGKAVAVRSSRRHR
jgi:hypothetical protein